MDPLSITVGMTSLIHLSTNIFKKVAASDQLQELEDVSFYVDVFMEAQELMIAYPDAIPPSVPRILQNCARQGSELNHQVQKLVVVGGLFKETLKKRDLERLSRRISSYKSLLMMLRQVVIDSVMIHLVQQANEPNSLRIAQTKGPIPSHPESSRAPTTAQKTSLNVTLWGGVHNEKSIWIGAHAFLDTMCDGNWITRDRLNRADQNDGSNFGAQLVLVENHDMRYVDFAGTSHTPTHKITLTWYWGARSQTRDTELFVSDAGPFDILIGHELMDSLNLDDQIVLPIVARRHTAVIEEKAQMDATAAEQLAIADAKAAAKSAAEAAERQQRRQQRVVFSSPSNAASTSSGAPSVSESGRE